MKRTALFLAISAILTYGPRFAFADALTLFQYVNQVAEQDGDTIATTQVLTSCTTGCAGPVATLSAAVTDKSIRRRVFTNTSGFEVFIGTAAVQLGLNTSGFRLDASTGTAHTYTTYSSAAFYAQSVGSSSATVTVITETNAKP